MSPESPSPNDHKNHVRIAVIDDSEFSRKSIIGALESEGYHISGEAATAEEAINILNSAEVNILIMDVVMPDVNGIDLAGHIGENFKKINIIMVSSLEQEHVVIEAIAAGAKDFLHKPFKKEDLLFAVEKIAKEIQDSENP